MFPGSNTCQGAQAQGTKENVCGVARKGWGGACWRPGYSCDIILRMWLCSVVLWCVIVFRVVLVEVT